MQSKLQNLNLTYKCLLELNLYLFKKREINIRNIVALKGVWLNNCNYERFENIEKLIDYYFLSK